MRVPNVVYANEEPSVKERTLNKTFFINQEEYENITIGNWSSDAKKNKILVVNNHLENTWPLHNRLGHANFKMMNEMAKQ